MTQNTTHAMHIFIASNFLWLCKCWLVSRTNQNLADNIFHELPRLFLFQKIFNLKDVRVKDTVTNMVGSPGSCK